MPGKNFAQRAGIQNAVGAEFDLFDILPQLLFQAVWQAHHPVQHGQADNGAGVAVKQL